MATRLQKIRKDSKVAEVRSMCSAIRLNYIMGKDVVRLPIDEVEDFIPDMHRVLGYWGIEGVWSVEHSATYVLDFADSHPCGGANG